MARETKTPASAGETEAAQDLIALLQKQGTTAELWKLGGTDEFKAKVAELSEADAAVVRDTFRALDVLLKGKVKAEDVGAKWDADKATHVGGVVLRVMSWDYPPASPKFPDSEFVVLKGTREDNSEKFEMVSGATRVVRFFKNIDPRDVPQRIMLIQESPSDIAARGGLRAGTQAMWLVKRYPTAGADRNATGTPF